MSWPNTPLFGLLSLTTVIIDGSKSFLLKERAMSSDVEGVSWMKFGAEATKEIFPYPEKKMTPISSSVYGHTNFSCKGIMINSIRRLSAFGSRVWLAGRTSQALVVRETSAVGVFKRSSTVLYLTD
jgi:hypothetical protein